jgi:hypothetical protein
VRRLPALLTTAALVTVLAPSLAGCSVIPGFGGCERLIEPGEASELVTAEGPFGSAPDVSFPTPLIADTPQSSVLIAGEGDPIPHRGTVDFEASILLGGSGESVTESAYDDAALLRVAGLPDSLSQAMECAQVGERFALTAKTVDAFGAGALESVGIGDEQTLVIVIDVMASYLGKADGVNQLPLDGMPAVVTAPDGQPGITVPGNDAPTELRVATIKAGGGAVVADGDSVVLHFSEWTWPAPGDDPTEVDSSWAGAPKLVEVPGDLAGVASVPPPGALEQLIGAKVGSQVLIVIPASEAYPSGPPANIDPASTLILVVDILGIQK